MGTAVMTEQIVEMSPRSQVHLRARIAGLLYLIVIVGGVFAEIFVRGRLVVHGDAAATAHNILTHELLYRLGFAAEIFICLCNVPLVFIVYELFEVVNKKITLLMLLFSSPEMPLNASVCSLISHRWFF
jgi:hypothetical protein